MDVRLGGNTGITIFAFGVVAVPVEEAAARKLFSFAKEMGIETIASEPKADQFDLMDLTCFHFFLPIFDGLLTQLSSLIDNIIIR